MSSDPSDSPAARTARRTEQALKQVRRALEGLRFGTITLTVQDGVVVQLERSEKVRLSRVEEIADTAGPE